MNYQRHFQLRDRAREVLGLTILLFILAGMFGGLATVMNRGWPFNVAATMASLAATACVGCAVVVVRAVRVLVRLEYEDQLDNLWRSRPRIRDDQETIP